MAKSLTYHMFSFEDRPPPYFLDQLLADPVLNIPEVFHVKEIVRESSCSYVV